MNTRAAWRWWPELDGTFQHGLYIGSKDGTRSSVSRRRPTADGFNFNNLSSRVSMNEGRPGRLRQRAQRFGRGRTLPVEPNGRSGPSSTTACELGAFRQSVAEHLRAGSPSPPSASTTGATRSSASTHSRWRPGQSSRRAAAAASILPRAVVSTCWHGCLHRRRPAGSQRLHDDPGASPAAIPYGTRYCRQRRLRVARGDGPSSRARRPATWRYRMTVFTEDPETSKRGPHRQGDPRAARLTSRDRSQIEGSWSAPRSSLHVGVTCPGNAVNVGHHERERVIADGR